MDTFEATKLRITAFLIIASGFGLMLYGLYDWRLNWISTSEPQQLTVRKLIEEGHGGNLHVALSEYRLGRPTRGNEGRETAYFVPVFPTSGPTNKIAVVLKFDEQGEPDLDPLRGLPTVTGCIVNGLVHLNSGERTVIRRHGSGGDPDTCWIIAPGRQPTRMGGMLWKFGGGLVLIVLGGGMFWMLGQEE